MAIEDGDTAVISVNSSHHFTQPPIGLSVNSAASVGPSSTLSTMLHDTQRREDVMVIDPREVVAGPSRIRRGSVPISKSIESNGIIKPEARRQGSVTTSTSITFDSRSHRNSISSRSRPESPDTALSRPGSPTRPSTPHLDLATFPTTTLLRLLASLLQQIATANDLLRPDLNDDGAGDGGEGYGDGDTGGGGGSRPHSRHSSISHSQPHPSPTTALFTSSPVHDPSYSAKSTQSQTYSWSNQKMFSASLTSLSHPSSLLSFHARHIPSITIEAYLLRILKYCPTTNEVFLGLLVYFDRMSKLGTREGVGGLGTVVGNSQGGRGFAIDSYNVHRLVIAGVTVASKFFSDVFYTNSRYAKVGGLPPHELNQLELQFLLLNDFRLVIPLDEMQRYGDRLLGYWEGREGEAGDGIEHGTRTVSGGGTEAESQRGRSRVGDNRVPPRQSASGAPLNGNGIPNNSRTATNPSSTPDAGPSSTVALQNATKADSSIIVTAPEVSEAMDVDQSDSVNPGQPLPESSETASEPPTSTQMDPTTDNTSSLVSPDSVPASAPPSVTVPETLSKSLVISGDRASSRESESQRGRSGLDHGLKGRVGNEDVNGPGRGRMYSPMRE